MTATGRQGPEGRSTCGDVRFLDHCIAWVLTGTGLTEVATGQCRMVSSCGRGTVGYIGTTRGNLPENFLETGPEN